ncbi:MAG: hypothetical protein KKE59_01180 [Proteobacteria bacterium]|nr:hypothetical protein [Pseudomonadota bacterium]
MYIKNNDLRYPIDRQVGRKAYPSGNADNQQPASRRETAPGRRPIIVNAVALLARTVGDYIYRVE